MFKLISLFIIFFIFIFIIYKKKYILNRSRLKLNLTKNNYNNKVKTNIKQLKYYSNKFNLNDANILLNSKKAILKKEMINLFKGNKEEKIKALKIAEYLSNKSTIPILKLGLKDMDTDIVEFSAKLIQKFK